MKKKITSFILTSVLLMGLTFSVKANDTQYSDSLDVIYPNAFNNIVDVQDSDVFNNDVFEIVAPIERYFEIPGDIELYREFSQSFCYHEEGQDNRYEKVIIGYDGKITKEELHFDSEDDFYKQLYENELAVTTESFNDGWRFKDNFDENYNQIAEFAGYVDINGDYKYIDGQLSQFTYDYNLGYLVENYYVPYAFYNETKGEVTITDTISKKKYLFKDAITSNSFDDNGYSVLYKINSATQEIDGYVIKLKKAIIPTVWYNNEKIKFDQIPIIDNGRTLVPLRAIFEKLGADVEWNEETKTVTATKDSTKVQLTIGDTTAYKNSQATEIDVPSKIVNGRTLVPVRFIADCFDVDVQWNGDMKKVDLKSK